LNFMVASSRVAGKKRHGLLGVRKPWFVCLATGWLAMDGLIEGNKRPRRKKRAASQQPRSAPKGLNGQSGPPVNTAGSERRMCGLP
jgi:hypothetical protein